MIIGPRIKELRKAKHLSQAELGKKVGLSQGVIADIENGRQQGSRKTLLLAHALEVGVREIDPGFPDNLPSLPEGRPALGLMTATVAFEAMIERPCPRYTEDVRRDLGQLFLQLALEPLDEGIDEKKMLEVMRERLRLAIRPYL